MIFLSTGIVHAEETTITAEARYLNSSMIRITGSVTNPKSERISLVFGNPNTLLYVDETDIVNGEFSFTISLDSKVPAHEHTYILSTESAQFTGTIKTRGLTRGKDNIIITADIDFSVKNYVPTFSGSARCTPGTTVQVHIKDTSSNTEIIADTVSSSDGIYEFSYVLPSLVLMHNYTITITSNDGTNTRVSASLSVRTSPLLVSFDGPIYAAPSHSMYVRVKSVNTDLIDKTMSFANRTWNTDFTIPNLISNCDFDISVTVHATETSMADGSVKYMQNPELYDALKTKFPHLDSSDSGCISIEELKSLQGTLDLSKCNITSLEGMQSCTELSHLYLNNNRITDISPLLTLNKLRYLDVSNNNITKLYRIPPYLKHLDLSGNAITDIDALNLTDTIVHLDIAKNKITNIKPISGYKILRYLNVKNNQITNLNILPKRKYARLFTSGNN